MKKNAFTIVELIVSFILVSFVTFALFRTVLSLQRVQQKNIYQNAYESFQIVLNKTLGKDLREKTITSVSSCDANCYDITYTDGTVRLSIDKENGIFTYGPTKEKIPKKYKFMDDLSITKYVSNSSGVNSFISIVFSLKSEYSEKIDELKYLYTYDSAESNVTYTNISDNTLIFEEEAENPNGGAQ